MFESARLKLTAWYLLIIMLISTFFSLAFYQSATQEIQMIMDRIEYEQQRQEVNPFRQPRLIPPFTLAELQSSKDRIKINLIILNGIIFIVAGGAGYFLAGRTLRPIKIMLEDQDQFISSASHELRTPIATMRAEMESNLMEKKITEKQARALITSNLEEIATLQELINSLLRLAHINNKTDEKYSEVLSLPDIIKTAEKKVGSIAKKKHTTINSKVSKNFVIGDKHSLVEVFVILFDNAIKYSAEKSSIVVSTKKEKDSIVVSVTDNGPGISKKDMPRIFERFYRADKARSKEGYGLGLSIAKKIIDLHNGEITVTSKTNKGTTFIVKLPQKVSA